MKTRTRKSLLMAGMVSMMLIAIQGQVHASNSFYHDISTLSNSPKKGQFRYGQYVYVKLKHGEETIGKIDGRKNTNKYYIDEVHGNRYGAVHKKYIRALTVEELRKLKDQGADSLKHLSTE